MHASRSLPSLLLLSVLLSTSACAGDDGGSEGSDTGETTVTYSTTYLDFVSGTNVQGVEACVRDHADLDCGTSDAEGAVSLEVPAGEEIAIRNARDGYLPSNWHVNLSADVTDGTYSLLTFDTADLFSMLAGSMREPGLGAITGFAPEGTAVTITGDSGFGPIYVGDDSLPGPDLTATSSNRAYGFINLPAGEYDVTFAPPTDRNCSMGAGWAGDGEWAIHVVVYADEVSSGPGPICEAP